MTKTKTEEKLYYSISEVSQMTGLEAYVLRYWEKEFPMLHPRKNRGGNRTYTRKDIELIHRINHLRNTEKLTIAGTRNKLMLKRGKEDSQSMVASARARTLISQIRKDVRDLLEDFS